MIRSKCSPAPRPAQSCLLFFQATLSNKIQRQDHLFFSQPFQILLITSSETASVNHIFHEGLRQAAVPQLESQQEPLHDWKPQRVPLDGRSSPACHTPQTRPNPLPSALRRRFCGERSWRNKLSSFGEDFSPATSKPRHCQSHEHRL